MEEADMDEQVEALAQEALSYPEDQRRRFLRNACSSEEELEAVRERITELRASDEAAGLSGQEPRDAAIDASDSETSGAGEDVSDSPVEPAPGPNEPTAASADRIGAETQEPDRSGTETWEASPTEEATANAEKPPSSDSSSSPPGITDRPERVGPWRLVESIGRGGMGTVYRAERADGQFQQQAALKLIRHDLGPEAQKRFLSERQILAQLQHPNIAHLLDGGLTDDGRPYFAMEYVDGTPIDTFCNEHELGVEARLRLFQQVCEAVQFAHSNLIVHRDLKPSNILVAEPDTDSGGAVSTKTATTGFTTGSGPQVKLLDFGIAKALEGAEDIDSYTRTEGSPMTPPYATPEQVEVESITTGTDVYAMGVVLCELLTGSLPYDVRRGSQLEAAKAIAESEPKRLSRLVEENPDTDVVAACGRSAEALQQRLEGDLDVIVQKALRKEPDRRYTSATDFGQDIDRHLNGLPVEARPATTGYRLRRFVTRNRTAVLSAVGAVMALLLGLGVAVWQAQVAASERDRAQQLAEEAQQNAERAEAVQTFLVDMIGKAAPATTGGEPLTMREVLDEAEAELESEAMQGQPTVSMEVRRTVADMYFILDDTDTSVEHARRAYKTGVEALGPEHPLSLKAAGTYGKVLFADGQLDRADSLFNAVVPRLETSDPSPEIRASLLSKYGELLVQLPRLDRAERVLHRALDWSNRMEEPDTSHLSRTFLSLGGVYRRKGRLDKAEKYYRQTLSLVKDSEENETILAYALGTLADVYKDKGDYARAETMYRRGLALNRKLYGERSVNVAASLEYLSRILRLRGKLEEADSVSVRAVEIMREVYSPEDYRIGFGLTARMKVLQALGRLEEASSRGEEAIKLLIAELGPSHPYVIEPRTDLATIYRQAGNLQAASRHAEKALEGYRARHDSTTSEITAVMSQLGAIRTEQGRYEEAEELLMKAKSARAADSATVAKTRERLSTLHENRPRSED